MTRMFIGPDWELDGVWQKPESPAQRQRREQHRKRMEIYLRYVPREYCVDADGNPRFVPITQYPE
jgi:hypothetical protein